jgi:hypothetical protein
MNGNEQARIVLLAQLETLAAAVFRYVAPLAVPDPTGEYLEAAGSLVLLTHMGKRFIVTAAHNLDHNPGCTFYVGTDTEWVEIPLGFFATHEKQADGKPNRFDYAVLEVDANFASKLDGLDFLSSDLVAASMAEDLGGRHCVLSGYPDYRLQTLRGYRTSSEKLLYRGSIANRSRHIDAKLKQNEHIAVSHSFRRVIGPKGWRKPPDLSGTSGGGIFILVSARTSSTDPGFRLVAITSNKLPARHLVYGARIDVILRSIELKFIVGDGHLTPVAADEAAGVL